MNRLLSTAAAAALAVAALAQAPDQARLSSGARMLQDRNPEGCVNSLSLLAMQNAPLTPEQAEQYLYLLARATVELGAEESLEVINRFQAQYPASPLRHRVEMLRGDYHLLNQSYAEALKAYLELDPACFGTEPREQLEFRTAFCYMMLGETQKADRMLQGLLGSPRYGKAARFYRAYVAYTRGDYSKALEEFAQVDRGAAPGDQAGYYEAQIYFAQGNYRQAIEAAKAMENFKGLPDMAAENDRVIGESLYNLGHEQQAVPYLWKYCDAVSDDRPVSKGAFYILGLSEFRQGNWDNAVKLLQNAIGSHSAMEQSAYLLLGQAYQKRGEPTQAMMAFENAYRVDYDREVRETAFYNYAVALSQGANVPFSNSAALLEDFLQDYPDSRYAQDVRNYVVSGLMTDDDYEHALNILGTDQSTPQLRAARQRVLLVLGTRQYSAGKPREAATRLEEAVKIDADPSLTRQARLWLGDCYYRMARYDKAAQCYRDFLADASGATADNVQAATYGMAYALFSQKKYKDALGYFNRYIKALSAQTGADTATLLADAYNRAGDCQYYLRDFTGAQRDYQRALDVNPQAGDYAMYQIAIMSGLQKNQQAKIATLDRMMSLYPTSGLAPAALLAKAESQTAMGHPSEAIATYSELVRTYPNTRHGRNGYLQLALTRLNSGDRAGAIETYKKVITTYPTSEEARLAADDLKRIMAQDGKLEQLSAFLASVPGAPTLEKSEIETLAFQAAENQYALSGDASKLAQYLLEYPAGTHEAEALGYMAQVSYDAGKNAEAQEFAAQLLLTHPDAAAAEDVLLIKGRAELAQGKTEAALNTFRELEGRASTAATLQQARLGALRAAAKLGRSTEVIALADRMATSSAASADNAAEIALLRAQALEAQKQYDQAYAAFAKLEQDMNSEWGAKAALAHAQSLKDRGMDREAERMAQALIDSNTPQVYSLARAYILYSDLLRKRGDTFEADEYLRSLRKNYPGKEPEIFKMIDQRLK